MIIASIFMVVLGASFYNASSVGAHHSVEPCSVDPTVVSSGSLPACSDSPDFNFREVANESQAKEGDANGRKNTYLAIALGTALFSVCILFFSRFSAKL